MISHARFRGGSVERSFGSHTTIYVRRACVWVLDATAPSLRVTLPDPVVRRLRRGGPQLLLVNVGANAFGVTTPANSPTLLCTVQPGDCAELHLLSVAVGNAAWVAKIRTLAA